MSLLKKKDVKKTEQEKVDERREEVLSKGRKFKYPAQWTKHRIVINTILISVVMIALIITGLWLALYKLGMTDDLLFRVTKIVPVPVASVDSENALFSDYLMLYKSSMTSIERQSATQLAQESIEDIHYKYKRTALTDTESYTYAIKLAKEQGIEISEEDVAKEFDRHMKIGGIDRSEEAFMKIVDDNFGLDKSEYERMLYLSLVKSAVAIKIDTKAAELASKVESMLKENGNDFQAVATELGDQIIYEETGGLVDSKNIDGGRAAEAFKLEPGASSGKFTSMNGDGYYFVKLINKTDSQVNFASIHIPFTEFNKRFESLKTDDKISEYITITEPSPAGTTIDAPQN